MKLLITGAWNCSDSQIQVIKELGFEIEFMQCEQEELPCNPKSIDAVICNSLFLFHSIEQFDNLKFIQTTSAGLDKIPLEYCEDKRIIVKNAKGVYSIPMAEFAVSGILDLYKQKYVFFKSQENHKWKKERNLLELADKIVLIIGCGSVGTECAKRLKSFGCIIRGIDITKIENSAFEEINDIKNIEGLLSGTDIVIITIPLTEDTRGLFDEKMFSYMKDNSLLVNVARGEIVNTKSLIYALQNKLLGAVLDVFDEEPLNENSELWSMKNVIVTPHCSFIGDGNNNRLFEVIYENLRGVL